MRYDGELRWRRILGFAVFYFLLSIASVVFSMTRSLSGSSELAWYLQNPWNALVAISEELIRNPALILQFLIMILYSFIYGFITDWVFRFLRRHILLRKRKQRAEFNQESTNLEVFLNR